MTSKKKLAQKRIRHLAVAGRFPSVQYISAVPLNASLLPMEPPRDILMNYLDFSVYFLVFSVTGMSITRIFRRTARGLK